MRDSGGIVLITILLYNQREGTGTGTVKVLVKACWRFNNWYEILRHGAPKKALLICLTQTLIFCDKKRTFIVWTGGAKMLIVSP